jgi:hypothetical protein
MLPICKVFASFGTLPMFPSGQKTLPNPYWIALESQERICDDQQVASEFPMLVSSDVYNAYSDKQQKYNSVPASWTLTPSAGVTATIEGHTYEWYIKDQYIYGKKDGGTEYKVTSILTYPGSSVKLATWFDDRKVNITAMFQQSNAIYETATVQSNYNRFWTLLDNTKVEVILSPLAENVVTVNDKSITVSNINYIQYSYANYTGTWSPYSGMTTDTLNMMQYPAMQITGTNISTINNGYSTPTPEPTPTPTPEPTVPPDVKYFHLTYPINQDRITTYPSYYEYEAYGYTDEPLVIHEDMYNENTGDYDQFYMTGPSYINDSNIAGGPIKIRDSDIIWTNGQQRWRIQIGNDIVETIYFEIDLNEQQILDIRGYEDNMRMSSPPTVTIQKVNEPAVELYFNGEKFKSYGTQDITETFTFKLEYCKVGTNTVEVKDINGNVLLSKPFVLETDSSGNVNPNPYENVDNMINDDKTWADFNITDPRTWFYPIEALFQKIMVPFQPISAIIKTIFGWMPQEWISILSFAIAAGILLKIIGRG